MPPVHSVFETELQVRPDDIDMNQHVHSSRYIDYVLAARYDQMARCYKMPMDEFLKLGYGWVIRVSHIEFKRPLLLGERFLIRTSIEEIYKDGVKVSFHIVKKETGKLICDGYFHYTMVALENGRAAEIPEWIVEKYSI